MMQAFKLALRTLLREWRSGELGVVEAATVECGAGEVEVQPAPVLSGGGAVADVLEVGGDDPDDGVADFPQRLEGLPVGCGRLVAGVRLVDALNRSGQPFARRLAARMSVPVVSVPLVAARSGLATTRAVAASMEAEG